jgi:hypothetical protein
MRRFTRLTNAFSNEVENLAHAVSLHYMHYSLARVHQSLTVKNDDGARTQRAPAIAAGVADHVWTLRKIAALLDSNLTPYRNPAQGDRLDVAAAGARRVAHAGRRGPSGFAPRPPRGGSGSTAERSSRQHADA